MSASKRTLKEYLFIAVKGMAMGAADIVPGVSGGTVALITGVYEEFLSSLKGLTPATLLVLIKQGPKAFWQHINGNFLFALFLGILISVKTLASVVSWCLESHPLLVWAAFSGLIAASLFVIARQQKTWGLAQIIGFVCGAVFVVSIAVVKPTQAPDTSWMLFLGGFIAISAMILPGISGSFILLLLGLYPVFLEAVESLDIASLAIIALGCICGLLLFSRFLSWLLAKWHATTLSVMLGFLLGSLYVTWPWKQVVQTTIDRHGDVVPLIQKNILPSTYDALSVGEAQLGGVILSFVLGVVLVLLVEFVSGRKSAE